MENEWVCLVLQNSCHVIIQMGFALGSSAVLNAILQLEGIICIMAIHKEKREKN